MSKEDLTELLGDWEGYGLGTVGRHVKGGDEEVWIELIPLRGVFRRCSQCGQKTDKIHDTDERWVRDLPILDCPNVLMVHRCRVACPSCGPKLEALSWLERYARVTRRLAESVARMCEVMTIQHVAQYWGLSWKTVRAIDQAYLERS